MRETVQRNAPIHTWFGVGGRADRLARPGSLEELTELVRRAGEEGQRVRVLGDGANLLVDDHGVDGLVLTLDRLNRVEAISPSEPGLLRVGAGANLMRLVADTVRDGLAGLETLAGIPASLGGALVMNAGGAFGQMADTVVAVHTLRPDGQPVSIPSEAIAFGYRHSGLENVVITGADLRLRPTDDPAALRERLKEIMAYKKSTQPMADRSAGCVFKNPTMPNGERVSAGMLIDKAGLKGLAKGAAQVSPVHANFFVTGGGACARDVIRLIGEVRRRVQDHHGVLLEPEIAIWTRTGLTWEDIAA
ncbi:MAG: UDP-N-acetylmuramate dehydrogenase [Phycisphaerales bacterium]|nr:UDP-N-acetylmuramate dehydrogenase [Phycisphaerales bacterium]